MAGERSGSGDAGLPAAQLGDYERRAALAVGVDRAGFATERDGVNWNSDPWLELLNVQEKAVAELVEQVEQLVNFDAHQPLPWQATSSLVIAAQNEHRQLQYRLQRLDQASGAATAAATVANDYFTTAPGLPESDDALLEALLSGNEAFALVAARHRHVDANELVVSEQPLQEPAAAAAAAASDALMYPPHAGLATSGVAAAQADADLLACVKARDALAITQRLQQPHGMAEVNEADYCGETPLLAAVANDDEAVVCQLLRANANVLAQVHVCLWTPLHRAAARGNARIVDVRRCRSLSTVHCAPVTVGVWR
ncbi:uncharacterized protein MONBRDRAFT_6373 [Monosiga brevicollis MX1]|uniref:Uncharacterized protein n=1 Tax=Monosiga brevicollis TaxID=81824 RepID=A9UTN4_MONBE|nr:uncharacterized protein MONBRDRAFT_6373 [Monosiga brevicollis MX1]EDQ91277.1 predicted protein [Monosiga brevicollis MX1]|eukprot:XP_001743699.1 hypothetical protein [Monosiga brevicollis MX1]